MSVPLEQFQEVEELARSYFRIKESLFLHGVPTFVLEPGPTKEPFEKLAREAKTRQLVPFLRRQRAGELILSFFPEPKRPPLRLKWNALLLVITLGTIFLSGWILGWRYAQLFEDLALPVPDLATLAVLFTAGLFLIIGLHECGHKVASCWNRIESSAPYFIPGPPPIGTFGAVIVQRGFPINRDQLFDVGFSGLLLGFLTTITIALIGVQLCAAIPLEAIGILELRRVGFPQIPPLVQLLLFTRPLDRAVIILDHPMLIAAYIGCIITFLNALPIWQLDGGHVARAILGRRGHRIIGFLAWASLLFLGPYMLMALFLLFALLTTGGIHPGPLDDVSPLSTRRKVLSVLLPTMVALCFTVPAI